ncbi:MAG: beta-lactamase family protein [Acidimicrobiia bacterium]|nr:beta-lactamase family protein [Acidimicrobiia bacterium]
MNDSVRKWIDGRAESGQFSGVALVARRGETVFEHAAGLAHRGLGVPVTVGTRFQVASVTKMMSAVAALRLVEEGAIALDTPLTEVLPPELRPGAVAAEHTMHHLLCHMSGLANYHDDEDESWASFVSCWDRIPCYRIREVADMLPLFADLPSVFAPGEDWRYSDSNYILIGLIIEQVTGRRYRDFVADEVLAPAGMADTSFTDLDFDPPGLALGYATSDRPNEKGRSNLYAVPAAGMPDGGIITTAGDLARFFEALDGGRLVSDETYLLMMRPNAFIPDTDGLEAYGYGLELTVVDGRVTILGHAGGDPGVAAITSYFVDDGMSVIVLCNQDAGSWAVSKRLCQEVGLDDPRE